MKPFFTAKDMPVFKPQKSPEGLELPILIEWQGLTLPVPVWAIQEFLAERLNAKIEREGKVVRQNKTFGTWNENVFDNDTHKALLINVEKIE